MFDTYTPDVEALVSFLSTEAGGRQGAVVSDYRGDFYFQGQYYVAVHEFLDRESVEPGQTVQVALRFLRPKLLAPLLDVNATFEIREGPNTVATGRVTKVVDLLKHAEGPLP